MASWVALLAATYSVSVVEIAVQDCLLLPQDMAPLRSRKMYPDVHVTGVIGISVSDQIGASFS